MNLMSDIVVVAGGAIVVHGVIFEEGLCCWLRGRQCAVVAHDVGWKTMFNEKDETFSP